MLGNTLALYPPALRVAEEFAMLDCMTDGRLAAGFPVGTSMDVNRCYGVTPTETRPRFYEAHDLIMKAWTQPGPFPFNGRFNKLRYVNPWPQPLQKPHPPVWLAGGGSVETYEMAVNNDYTYSFLSFFGYRFAKKVMDGFWETADRLGADRNPYRAGFAQQICVAETDAQAEELYSEHVMYFFKKCLHVPSYFMETPGYRTKRSAEFIMKTNSPSDLAAAATARNDWSSLVDQGFVIAGSPATVTERLIEACRGLRVGNLIALLADRLDAARPDDGEHHPVRQGRDAQDQRAVGRRGLGAPLVAARRPPGRARRLAGRRGVIMAEPTERFLELRDGMFKIRVLEAGSGSPLLYLHGAGGLFWDPLLDRLAATHRVIAPEHPGAGESQGLEHVEDLWDLVLYYDELLDAVGVDTAVGRRPLLRRDGRGGAGFDVAAARRAARADRADRPVARRPPRPRHLRHPAGVHPRARLRGPEQPARRVDAGTGPDRPGVAVPRLADDGEHPPVHLAAARQGAVEAPVPAACADAARVGGSKTGSSTPRTRTCSRHASPTRASRSSRAPGTCRSSNRPSGPSA